jgi:ferredoxin-NADP reductase
MSFLYFTVKEIIQETPDIRSFVLEPHDKAEFRYKAGQFLTFVKGEGTSEVRRSFSFSSHPAEPYPKVTLKRIPNGEISRYLFDIVKPGDTLRTIEPSGLFTYTHDASQYDTIMFMAAGSGITPIISLIKEALLRNDSTKLILLYSNRSKETTIFYDELEAMRLKYAARFSIQYFFSNNMDLQQARMSRLVLEGILKKTMKDPSRSLFYLCGPHVYMQNITITLLTEGVPGDNIRKEIFFNPLPPVADVPPDKEMHTVNIQHEGISYSLKVQFPKTILQTAKEHGIMLPYSCEAGRCGTCAATCTRGEIWMLRNEVLLDKEVLKGRALTCTGFAVGGDADLIV